MSLQRKYYETNRILTHTSEKGEVYVYVQLAVSNLSEPPLVFHIEHVFRLEHCVWHQTGPV